MSTGGVETSASFFQPYKHLICKSDYFVEPVYANLMLQQWQLEQHEDRRVGITRLEQLIRLGLIGNKTEKTSE
uniref:Transcriptional regulator n=1 Tax=Heterorhabditis bacteriophora TaxID=37862 RepID=A0A1I7X7B9_HETBA